MSSCSEDRKLAFLKRIRIRKSCSECYRYGTEKCVRIPEGFVCQCRTNWTMIYHSKLKQDLYSRKRKACRKRVRGNISMEQNEAENTMEWIEVWLS
ncbi:hypothetical protein Q1695_004164 [Nippostrongylus brasiliensis]|nr:hypothetical protein Q1695_004164 [Nippostrongylus brasiliensis]